MVLHLLFKLLLRPRRRDIRTLLDSVRLTPLFVGRATAYVSWRTPLHSRLLARIITSRFAFVNPQHSQADSVHFVNFFRAQTHYLRDFFKTFAAGISRKNHPPNFFIIQTPQEAWLILGHTVSSKIYPSRLDRRAVSLASPWVFRKFSFMSM